MKSLYDITKDFEALYDIVSERGGDITDPDVAKIIDDWFAELNTDLENKVDNYAAFIKELEARSRARQEESDRMEKRAKVDSNLAENLKERLKFGLQSIKRPKVETPRFTVSVQANGGVLPLIIDHEDDIPVDLCDKVPEHYEVNRDKVRKSLEAKIDIPGAHLGERGTQLRIR